MPKPIRIPNSRAFTRLKRSEGAANPQTGKLAVTYTEEEAEASFRSLNPKELNVLPAGSYPNDFMVLILKTSLVPLDRVEVNCVIYEVQNVSETWDHDSFAYRTAMVKKVAS